MPISCPRCRKTFRSLSGLTWHRSRCGRLARRNNGEPTFYHVTAESNWPSIQKKGLLPNQPSVGHSIAADRHSKGKIFLSATEFGPRRWAPSTFYAVEGPVVVLEVKPVGPVYPDELAQDARSFYTKKAIPPKNITLVDRFDSRDFEPVKEWTGFELLRREDWFGVPSRQVIHDGPARLEIEVPYGRRSSERVRSPIFAPLLLEDVNTWVQEIAPLTREKARSLGLREWEKGRSEEANDGLGSRGNINLELVTRKGWAGNVPLFEILWGT